MPESVNTETVSNCFGCAPRNPIGLRLVIDEDGTGCTAEFELGADYESFPGVVHGGVVASVLDELLAQAVYRSGRTSAFTSELRVRYAQPMRTGTAYTARAEVTRRDESSVRAAGRIRTPDGGLVAVADGVFHLLTDEVLDQAGDRLPDSLVQALRASNRP
ncbi:PaaI family thioesterase [Streptomyces rubellomurinus]|uniref:PaaI family thioesterase n=1 Tax=Streptomyces rubellomurinus (strain ATCC 31215) TaxID=359131 RepID=UPI0006972101|nr:PaaI family thioesterase [Streptomyces rubellomurinus]